MLIHKLRSIAMSVLALAVVATGAGFLGRSLAMKEGPMREPTARVSPQAAERPVADAPGRMTVAGRVLDAEGKPVAGAVVDLVTRPRSPWVAASDEEDRRDVLAEGRSDGDGRVRLDAPRTASTRVFEVYMIAAAPGYGVGWASLNPDAERPEGEIRLKPEQVVRARLVELTGGPAKGVEVRVRSMGGENDKGQWDGLWFGADVPAGRRAWPGPVKADDQGRIALPGIGRGVAVALAVRDLRYARQELFIDPRKAVGGEMTLALEPSRLIEGRVLAADTGLPIPHAVVSATTRVQNEHANGFFTAKFRADDRGRFVMNPIAGEKYTLGAFPTGGEPYLIPQEEFPWPRGAVKASHDIKLPRGVLIRGKVTEAGTGRPLAASSIQYMPLGGSSDDRVLSGWQAIVAAGDDGTFAIAVPPGKGHLLVFGPTGDFVLGEIGSNALSNGSPGGRRYRAHAIIPYEVRVGSPSREVAATLQPGATVKGRVEGPDGQTIADGFILTTLLVEAFNPFWRGDYQIPVRDGRFELHGIDPQGSARVHVLDAEHGWGATATVSGKQAGEELTIRLQPCGQAVARFVGPDGRPVAGHRPMFEFVATPGPNLMTRDDRERGELAADTEFLANVDRKHYWNGPATDAEGRITLVALIPGALYRFDDRSTANDAKKGRQLRKEFTVGPGETVDLGDILIEKP